MHRTNINKTLPIVIVLPSW